jgi:hypothetical protein
VTGNDFMQFSLNYNTINSITIDTIAFNWQRSATGTTGLAIRSSLDSYVGTLATFSVVDNTSVQSFLTSDLGASFENLTTSITFRIYGFSEAAGGSGGFEGTGADLVVNGAMGAAGGASFYWLGGDTTRGGTGTWANTGGTDWSATDADGAGVAWDSTKAAIFNTSPATVTLSGTVTANKGLTFATGTDGSTISGGTALNLAGATAPDNTISTDSAVTATISSDITLLLGGTNSFVGNVTNNAGTLSIGSDTQLGDTANDIVLGGTLRTTASIALNSGRDLSGTGTLDVAPATTLTVNGNVTTGGLTLSNTGITSLAGTNSVGLLAISANTTLQGTPITNVTGLTLTHTGTASISNNLTYSAGDKAVVVPTGATLSLSGSQTAAGRLLKTGAGTLELPADNSTLASSITLGSTSATPVDGGTVKIGHKNSLGASAASFRFNFGILNATTTLTGANAIPNPLSIGGRTGAPATISGSDTEFTGALAFFRGTGTSGQMVVNVNNNTTFGGTFSISGGGSATGFTFGGSGKLTLAGDWSANTQPFTVADTLTLITNTTVTSALTVGPTSTLGGSGIISGPTTIEGTHSPGNSPGLQTFGSDLTYSGGASVVNWELAGNTVSGRGTNFDGIDVAGTLDFAAATTLNLSFNNLGSSVDWTNTLWLTNQTWLLYQVTTATNNIGNFNIFTSNWQDSTGAFFDTVLTGSTFTLSQTGNDVFLNFTAIPEPSRAFLLGIGGLSLIFRRRRQ